MKIVFIVYNYIIINYYWFDYYIPLKIKFFCLKKSRTFKINKNINYRFLFIFKIKKIIFINNLLG